MRNRRLLWVVFAVVGVLAAWLVFRQAQEPPRSEDESPQAAKVDGISAQDRAPDQSTNTSPLASTNAGGTGPAVISSTPTLTTGAVAGVLSTPAVTDSTASPTPPDSKIETEKVRLMIRSYHNVMGENPVGTNAEIMQALMGQNPKQAQLGPPEGQSLNEKGELVDQWGTPFFFHQLSKDVMEIRSAGPDKIMGTADDSVSR